MEKMKYAIAGMLFLTMIVLGGCIDDQGNYDYQSVDAVIPARISGLAESYDLVFGTTRTLTAVVEGLENEDDYQFMWYLYKYPNNASRDTLGYGKTLEMNVTWETGGYHLWFEIRDKRTDVCLNHKMVLQVTTLFSQGWYIVKDAGGVTDVDFIDKDNQLMADILKTNTNVTLNGRGVKICYNSNHSHDVENADGTVTKLTKQKVFFVLSDQDMKVVNAENLMLYKNFEDCFYETPLVRKPENMMSGPMQVNLINGGKFHMLSGSSTNSGKFSYYKAGTYGVHPDMVDIASNRIVIFDTLSRSLQYVDNNTNALNHFSDPKPGTPSFGSLKNMDADLKRLMFWRSEYIPNPYAIYYHAYALMEKEGGKYYLATLRFNGIAYPLTGYDEVPAGCLIGAGTAHACHKSAPCIYFASGNRLYMHEVGSSQDPAIREHHIHTFPGDEEIVVIRQVQTSSTDNYLVVLTNHSTGWKLYRFPLISGSAEADFSDTKPFAAGEGTARYCMYLLNNNEY